MKVFPKNWRFHLIAILTTIFVLLLLIRYGSIMLMTSGVNISSQIMMPSVERGPILDRNGRILALQTQLNSVSAWIPNVSSPESAALLLSEALGLEEAKTLEKLKTNSGFVFIKRKISPTESTKIEALISNGKLEGISLQPEFGRNYPGKTLASHLIGYVGTDNIGLDGLEYTFNQELSPPIVGENIDMIYGNQVFLSIDLSVQYAMEKIAEDTLKSNKADSIMIMVMEAKSGDILGYASLPNYDPNSFSTLTPATMRNRPISLLYEPGSVFKVFSMATLLEIGKLTPEDRFFCNGHFETEYGDGKKIRINCLGNHGWVNVEGILKNSCNAGAAYASERVNPETFYQMLKLFGFGDSTGIPLNGEESGVFRSPRDWSIRSKPTIAIGQEISVTAMQIMKATSAIVNDGVLLQPHIVKKIVSPTGRLIKEYEREPLRQVISPETAKKMISYMESVTKEGGTATRARIPGVRVSAKTGTAQTIDINTGKYSETSFVASSLAFFPTEDPAVVVYVVIESPQGDSYFGGRVAAPVIQKAGEFLVPYLGLPRAGEKIVNHPGTIQVPRIEAPEMKDTVPDFTGLPKKALLPLLSRSDIKVVIKGSGWVRSQSPAPGTALTQGITLVLELR